MNNSPKYSDGYTRSEEEGKQSPVSEEQKTPAASFPREYVLAAFINLQDAQQAANALRTAGFDEQDTHVLENQDFMEAVAQDHSPFNIITSTSHDQYLAELQRGRSLLAVRPANLAQLEQIRDLLAPYGAYLVKYHDTWSQRELLP